MTKKQIITRFLQNSEASLSSKVSGTTVAVTYDGTEYVVAGSDIPYYEALLALPEWHPYPDEKPGKPGYYIVTTRLFQGQEWIDIDAQYLSRSQPAWEDNQWEGPGFYKTIDGDSFRVNVTAWMEKPEPYKEQK